MYVDVIVHLKYSKPNSTSALSLGSLTAKVFARVDVETEVRKFEFVR